MNNNYKNFNQEPSTPYPQAFWNNYTLFLLKHKVSKKYVNWYVLRTKQYITAYPEQNVRTHTPQQVESYLNQVSREQSLKSWQFTQIVNALQMLFSQALKLAETNKKLVAGWVYSGDLFSQDEDDFYYFHGRADDMIISGGENIYPREVEEVLYQCAGVQEAAVLGVKDERWGQRVVLLLWLLMNSLARLHSMTFAKTVAL